MVTRVGDWSSATLPEKPRSLGAWVAQPSAVSSVPSSDRMRWSGAHGTCASWIAPSRSAPSTSASVSSFSTSAREPSGRNSNGSTSLISARNGTSCGTPIATT